MKKSIYLGTVEAHTNYDPVIMQRETPERKFYLSGDCVYMTENGGKPHILTDSIRKDVKEFSTDYFIQAMGMSADVFNCLIVQIGKRGETEFR